MSAPRTTIALRLGDDHVPAQIAAVGTHGGRLRTCVGAPVSAVHVDAPALAFMEVRWNDTIIHRAAHKGGRASWTTYSISGMETPLTIPRGDYVEVSWSSALSNCETVERRELRAELDNRLLDTAALGAGFMPDLLPIPPKLMAQLEDEARGTLVQGRNARPQDRAAAICTLRWAATVRAAQRAAQAPQGTDTLISVAIAETGGTTVRAENILRLAGKSIGVPWEQLTIGHIVGIGRKGLRRFRGCGVRTMIEIRMILLSYDVTLDE